MKLVRPSCEGSALRAGSASCSSLRWPALVAGLGGIAATSGAGADTREHRLERSRQHQHLQPVGSGERARRPADRPLAALVRRPRLRARARGALPRRSNSLGESISDAGAPYSPSIASLPGTINGLGAGNFPPLPPLPGYVSASYPSNAGRHAEPGGLRHRRHGRKQTPPRALSAWACSRAARPTRRSSPRRRQRRTPTAASA